MEGGLFHESDLLDVCPWKELLAVITIMNLTRNEVSKPANVHNVTTLTEVKICRWPVASDFPLASLYMSCNV